jgi:hypothetical protein
LTDSEANTQLKEERDYIENIDKNLRYSDFEERSDMDFSVM